MSSNRLIQLIEPLRSQKKVTFAVRKEGPIPTHFQVFGERRSGTNFLNELIADHTNLKPATRYGWKHGLPSMPAIDKDALIVIIIRDPIKWLLSLNAFPFDSFHEKKTDISVFLRSEWHGRYMRTRLRPVKWGLGSFRLPDEITSLQLDRDPMTGALFETPMALRNAKNIGFLSLLNRHENVVLTRYEDVRADTVGFMSELSENFGIEHKTPPLETAHVGSPAAIHSELSDENRSYIWSKLDCNIEAFLNYTA